MTRGIAVLCVLAACVQSNQVVCSDGRICAPGNTCDDTHHRCLSPEQVAACDGHAEGDPCTLASVSGVCHDGSCEPLVCGDGLKTETELCDGADLGSATCLAAGFYEPDGLACTPFCTFDTSQCKGFCGDGMIDGPELCDGAPPQATCVDDGFDAGALQCSSSCGASFTGCGRFGWRPELTGVGQLSGLAGTSATDLWIVGRNGSDGVIGHFDGMGWTIAATAPGQLLTAIAQAAPGDVWAIGPATVMHLANGQWTTVSAVPAATYKDVFAIGSQLVLLATSDAGVLAWDGTSWQTVGSLAASLTTVRGTSASDLWATQSSGLLQHWDGASWQPSSLASVISHVDALAPDDVWVIGRDSSSANLAAHWNGATWTTYLDPSFATYTRLRAIADNDVWVAQSGGVVRHFDGLRWTSSSSRVTATASSGGFTELIALGTERAGVTFDGFFYRYTGQMYSRFLDNGDFSASQALWSDAPDDLFFTDSAGNVERFDGAAWSQAAVGAGNLRTIWGTGGSDVWTGDPSGAVYHFDGPALGWSSRALGVSNLQVIWGTGPADVWFFGSSAAHYTGGSTAAPTLTPANGGIFSCASGSGPNDVWAVALQTMGADVYHWDGSTWTGPTHFANAIRAITVVAPDDVYATADPNHILHFDGSTWSDAVVPALDNLRFATSTARDDVFVASGLDVFHFDGTRWAPMRPPSDPLLMGQAIQGMIAHRGTVDFLFSSASTTVGSQQVRRLIRTKLWNCRATETDCSDGVDDDCDGKVDGFDSDCP